MNEDIKPVVYNDPNRQLTLAEQEIYSDAREVINRTMISGERDEGPALFRYSAREAFQKIAFKVVETLETQMFHKTDNKIRLLSRDLERLGYAGFNDASRLGQTFKTCLFDVKAVPNPFNSK